ncbi:uncharacterized protein LOC126750321 [Anthonomus grandis grandis]|uniref:uncharacterized protein LOC126750321 n=1 Tax=Anthonomus grandis grandis TaxID=2921223 RepID=UPI002165C187|nr:uncharacterized protein LOC126750321 [Anthonomus grandis grandis]
MIGLCKNFGEEIVTTKENGINFTVSAPGKVILHGEHSVVYGRLAIAASLGLRTTVQLEEIERPNSFILKILSLGFEQEFDLSKIQENLLDKHPSLSSNISEFNLTTPKLIDHETYLRQVETELNKICNSVNVTNVKAAEAVKCIILLLSGILCSANIKLQPVSIKLDSHLDVGAGMGSSASFAVAFSAVFMHYLKIKTLKMANISKEGFRPFKWNELEVGKEPNFSEKELALISDWAFCGEQIFHGTPSGLDNTICTYGNLVEFRKHHPTVYIKLTARFRVLLINSMKPRQTHKMVMKVKGLKSTFPQLVEHILDAMEVLTLEAVDIMRKIDSSPDVDSNNFLDVKKNYDNWETIISINHSLLCSLGVTDSKIEEVLTILGTFGLTGKLTGAGGGGYVLCVLPPAFDPTGVIKKLKEDNFVVHDTYLGGEGVKVDKE